LPIQELALIHKESYLTICFPSNNSVVRLPIDGKQQQTTKKNSLKSKQKAITSKIKGSYIVRRAKTNL